MNILVTDATKIDIISDNRKYFSKFSYKNLQLSILLFIFAADYQ